MKYWATPNTTVVTGIGKKSTNHILDPRQLPVYEDGELLEHTASPDYYNPINTASVLDIVNSDKVGLLMDVNIAQF